MAEDIYEAIYSSLQQTAYDGASVNFRMEQQGLLQGEQDTLAGRELQFLNSRCDSLIRNNGWAANAKFKNRLNLRSLQVKWVRQSGTKKGEAHSEMQDLWDEFTQNPSLDGYGNFDNIQDGWNSAIFQNGEILCRKLIKTRKGVTVPLVLQNIPSNYLDPNFTGSDPLTTRNGITFQNNAPLVYHFDNRDIGWDYTYATQINYKNFNKILVPADEVIHIFQREKEGQWRGVPKLASVLLPLYELDDLTDAMVSKQKAAQALSWIVQNSSTTALNPIGSAVNSWNPDEIDPATGQRKVIFKANGGGVHYLNKGESLVSVEGAGLGSHVIDLIKLELYKIAQASGITYEMLTGDLSNVNMSSLQQLAMDMRTSAEFYYQFLTIPLGLAKVCNWFSELAPLYAKKSINNVVPTFQFPRRYAVNELKDAQADSLELQFSLDTLTRKLTERGLTIEEIKADKSLQKELGISFEPIKASGLATSQDGTSGDNQNNQATKSKPSTTQTTNVAPNSNSKGR